MKKISVVVCVKNEEERLRDCLESIKLNNPDEIIVVDGNSSDKTVEIARQYTDKVIVSYHSNLTRDRQKGIDAASFEYIAMIDGDHRLEKGQLRELLADLDYYNFDAIQSQLKSYKNSNWMNKGEEQMWDLFESTPGPSKMMGVAPAIFKKELFQKIRFDDTITKTIDDTDFAYRLSKIPGVMYGIGRVKIAQCHTASYQDYFRKFKWYGTGDGEFCIKHPNRAFSMFFHLFIRYPILYSVKAILKGKYYAALYCFLQGIVRSKWMIITKRKLKRENKGRGGESNV